MLTATQVKSLNKPGRYADRDGLYLNVGKSGNKSWVYRFQLDGRRREMGLGSLKDHTLYEARVLAADARKLHKTGTDPQVARALAKATVMEAQESKTFQQCADAYIDLHKAGWRNPKHVDQWRNTLATYAGPVIGNMPVDDVDTPHVLQILQPIWITKSETAGRVRGRIEAVLNWATVQKLRTGPNPAIWRGHLSMALPARGKVRRVTHHSAMPYKEVPACVEELRKRDTISVRALEFTILTAARTGEVIGARWKEFDLESRIWTIPASRMKAGRQHRVALSRAAVELLDSLIRIEGNPYVFPGERHGSHISNMSMLKYLKQDLGYSTLTVHGFRSSFRDWVAECTSFPGALAEAALAHALSNAVEAAYQRGDMLERRRELMGAWAAYCGGGNNVVALLRDVR